MEMDQSHLSIDLPAYIAHRGLSALAPENTFAAFVLAKSQRYAMFECDVQLTKDNIPVIIHDEKLNRTTSGQGLVCETPYVDIKDLDAGSWFDRSFRNERIPSLAGLLAWLGQHYINMNLELKGVDGFVAQNQKLAEIVAQMLNHFPRLKGRILISSFQFDALSAFKACNKDYPLGLLIDEKKFETIGFSGIQTEFEALGAYSLNLATSLITARNMKEFLKISERILVYTVAPDKAEALFDKGVVGVFTNG